MKKKSLIVLLLLVVMISAIALSGCSLVKLNESRQANRIMATVSQKLELNDVAKDMLNEIGITDYNISIDINRRELITSTNYTINRMNQLYQSYYNQSYSYDYETVMSDTLDSLIANKYYVIQAIQYRLNNCTEQQLKSMYMFANPDEYNAYYDHKISAEGVLTIAERYSAMGTVNESLQSLLDGYVENEEEDLRNDRISAADNKISEFYAQGYFVNKVYIGKEADVTENDNTDQIYKNVAEEGILVFTENKEKFVDGLYKEDFVVASGDSSDEKYTEVEYEKVYALIELKKDNDVVIVPRPVSSAVLSLEKKEDAAFIGKYFQTRTATITYTGRVAADNEDGYTSEEFSSEGVDYTVAFPRSALTEKAEEVDYLEKDEIRYAQKATWDKFLGHYDSEKKELKTETEAYAALTDEEKEIFAGMAELYCELFATTYNGTDKNVKDGYRQLRETLASANIGYVSEKPEDKNSDEYKNFVSYSGLFVYYNDQFMSVLLDAVKYEMGAKVAATDEEIRTAYVAKVLQDKAAYDSLSYAEQLEKFFYSDSSTKSDLTSVFYIPKEALETEYEIDPTDKAYKPLFNEDGTVKDSVKMDENGIGYVKEKDGKFYMPYLIKNGDRTYTINTFYVAHILFNFENVEKLSSMLDGDKIDGYMDLDEDKKLQLYTELAAYIETNKQVAKDGTLQEDVTEIKDLFELNEDGSLVMESVKNILNRFETEVIVGLTTREEILEKFEEYTVMYNDDGGKMKDPGYMIIAGDVSDNLIADFSNVSKEIYFTMVAAGKDPSSEAVLKCAYGPYGTHYIMITLTPFYHFQMIEVADGVYALADTTVLNLEGDTQYELIKESLETAKTSSAYSAWQAEFTDDDINSNTVRNEKNYKKLVKDITDNK